MPERNGYVPQSYGQRSTEGDGIVLQVIESESKKGIIFRLIQGAIVSGRVRDAQSQPLTGIRVVFRAVAPGDYKVMSWEGLEPHGYYDADLLSQQLSQARLVQVQELDVKTVDLRVTLPKP